MTVRQLIEELQKLPSNNFVTVCYGGAEQHTPVLYVQQTDENWVSFFLGSFQDFTQDQIDGKTE